jgi:signal peptidase I
MTDQRGLGPDPTSDDLGPRELVVTDPMPLGSGGSGNGGRDDDGDGSDFDGFGEGTPAAGPRPVKKKMNPLVEWLIVVAVAITSALLVRAYVVQQFAVEGESMLNTLQDGDRVLVNRLSYRLHDPRRGDVVVLKRFDSPSTPERDLIKRVVALEGERVRMTSCVVYINDQPLNEPYLDPAIQSADGCGGDQIEMVVPEDQVFVLGDHRGKSSDSRVFGTVPFDLLIGRAFVIIWPLSDWAWL